MAASGSYLWNYSKPGLNPTHPCLVPNGSIIWPLGAAGYEMVNCASSFKVQTT